MKNFKLLILLLVTLGGLLAACGTDTPQQPADPGVSAEGDEHAHVTELASNDAVRELFAGGAARIADKHAFRQVGFMMTSSEPPALQYRVPEESGWSAWADTEVTWSDGEFHNARILLDAPTTAVELRGAENASYLMIELFAEVEASLDTLARDLPLEKEGLEPQFGPSWVVSRSAWGARNPSKVCGSSHRPDRMTVHHTVGSSGSSNPAGVMRSIQAYHIDNRGWCDIGYHFVVNYNGTVYQGRDERRTGVHVYRQNTNNVGIALMGNFDTAQVPQAQLNGAAETVRWVGSTFGIALTRSNVKGHGERMSTACPGKNLLVKIPNLLTGGDTPPSCSRPTLEKDDRGSQVEYAQQRLLTKGDPYTPGTPAYYIRTSGGADGVFGEGTRKAVIAFQKLAFPSDSSEWDGVIGKKTWAKLGC